MNKEDQQDAFKAWAKSAGIRTNKHADGSYVHTSSIFAEMAYRAALESPEVQALRDALQEVVAAADGKGWDQLDPGLEKQRAALNFK